MPHIGSNLGYAYALAGRLDDAIPLMEKADEQSKLIGRKAGMGAYGSPGSAMLVC